MRYKTSQVAAGSNGLCFFFFFFWLFQVLSAEQGTAPFQFENLARLVWETYKAYCLKRLIVFLGFGCFGFWVYELFAKKRIFFFE